MLILFYTADTDSDRRISSTGYYRAELPARAFRRSGEHNAFLVPWVGSASGRIYGRSSAGDLIGSDADVVVLQAGWPEGITPETITAAHASGQVVIVDFDDLPRATAMPPSVRTVADAHPNYREVLKACSAVTVSTPYLARRVESLCPVVRVIRNAVDVDAWGPPEDVSDGPVLGWSAVLEWRVNDHDELAWLGPFLEKHDLTFIHVGDVAEKYGGLAKGTPLATLLGLDPERVSARPEMEFNEYLGGRPLAGFDVQVIPLTDGPWNRAKSALKGLESATCGVPFVASPTDEYRRLGFGRLAGTDPANQKARFWIAALEAMLDPAERVRMATEAREHVEREDISLRWRDWEKVYVEVLTART